MLFKKTVTKETFALIQILMDDDELKEFVLGGDTALALRLGHRHSEGIELFTTKVFDTENLVRHMQETYSAEIQKVSVNVVKCVIGRINIELRTL